ncbi:hypothetical protein [Paraburkholderia sp. GAS32]|jgi:hypothetical protein|uniref:hypothetical protein n=1 Tax=Paraburkholderia sp. GAS32 TaxID=3035129 RepID=UPI003D25D4FE
MASHYNGLEFKTTLLAQWAGFFDLAGWSWRTNPAPVGDWVPDFSVAFLCGHSECPKQHSLFVSVLPIDKIEDISAHPALKHVYSVADEAGNVLADAGAVFGIGPFVSHWEMAHGAGGGIESVPNWVSDAVELWHRAGRLVKATT